MKTKVTFLLFFMSLIVSTSFAANPDLDFKTVTVEDEFAKVNKLEEYLATHPNMTLEQVKQAKPELLEGIDLISSTNTNFAPTKDMPLVGGFWWGCCLGVVGLALVYFITDHDKDQVRKAFWGCVIATIVWGVGGFWNPFGW
jgi:hypothetical protein